MRWVRALSGVALRVGLVIVCVAFTACPAARPEAKLVYFGFDNHAEKREDAIKLARTWGTDPPCPHWRATINEEEADYRFLFGIADVTITDRRGEVLYSGGQGILYAPHGNPDGTGVDLCKLTGGR